MTYNIDIVITTAHNLAHMYAVERGVGNLTQAERITYEQVLATLRECYRTMDIGCQHDRLLLVMKMQGLQEELKERDVTDEQF